jgi:adenosine deaminase
MSIRNIVGVRGLCGAAFGLLVMILGRGAPAGPSPTGQITPEQRTANAFASAQVNPLRLRAFLFLMPKGGDLHNHLSGAVYAESWIRAAVDDHLCIDIATNSFTKGEAQAYGAGLQAACGPGQAPAIQAYEDQHLHDALVNAFSMRGFVTSSGVTNHDHFFATFSKFSGTDYRHTGEWLDEVATRAASQNEQYLELMETPNFDHTRIIAKEVGWLDDLSRLRTELLARGLRDDIPVARAGFDQAEAVRQQRERCGQPDEAPGCQVQIRYLYQVLRAAPREIVFAQALLGFETAVADHRVVGINLVQPEDGRISMADYALHMKIFGFLHGLYPQVHISLHAGELAPGLVPPTGLCCHIRLAIEIAGAERIGHGADVMYEDRPYQLLKEMAEKHIMVEINFTSNEVILGVSGKEHPFPVYREFGVPVALSTDDEGVSRTDLTHEYIHAVKDYGLQYADLKRMVRTSIEHSFLPGASVWREPDVFTRVISACSHDATGGDKPSVACTDFLKSSERARQEWELERRFHKFESGY